MKRIVTPMSMHSCGTESGKRKIAACEFEKSGTMTRQTILKGIGGKPDSLPVYSLSIRR
ncbi:MAG: hypothetical protein ABGZ35_00565 [Planctomycetaceae bacterium]